MTIIWITGLGIIAVCSAIIYGWAQLRGQRWREADPQCSPQDRNKVLTSRVIKPPKNNFVFRQQYPTRGLRWFGLERSITKTKKDVNNGRK